GRCSHSGHQNLALLNVAELIRVSNHASNTFNKTRRRSHTLQNAFASFRTTTKPGLHLLGSDAPQHARERFSDGLWRLVECRSRTRLLQRFHQSGALGDDFRPQVRADWPFVATNSPRSDQVIEDIANFVAVQVE